MTILSAGHCSHHMIFHVNSIQYIAYFAKSRTMKFTKWNKFLSLKYNLKLIAFNRKK